MRKVYLRVAALICIGISLTTPLYSAFTSSSGDTQLGKAGDNVTVVGSSFTVTASTVNINADVLKATSTEASFESVTGYGGGLALDLVGSTQPYSTITDFNRLLNSSGWTTGGIITLHTSSATIAAGTGFIRASDISTDTVRFFNWSESQVLIPADATRYIGVEYNAGTPQLVSKVSDDWDLTTEFPLYLIIEEDGVLHNTDHRHSVNDLPSRLIEWVHNVNHIQRDEETGGVIIDSTDTYVTVSSGALWLKYIRSVISEVNTHGSDTFDRYATDSPGTGFIKQSDVSEWDNARYDTGTGTAAISNNRYSSQYFYMELDGQLTCVYGRGNYVTLSGALNDTTPPFVPDRISEHALLIGRITFQEGASLPSLVETIFTSQFVTAGVSDHQDLSNRSTIDAHAQYLLKAGDTMTGPLDMDVYSFQSSSSVHANDFFGSGAGVTDVDAETLDGFNSDYFLSTATAASDYLTKSSATATYESTINHNNDMSDVADSTNTLDTNKLNKSGDTMAGQLDMDTYAMKTSSSIEGVTKIVWADGTVQVSSPTAVGVSGANKDINFSFRYDIATSTNLRLGIGFAKSKYSGTVSQYIVDISSANAAAGFDIEVSSGSDMVNFTQVDSFSVPSSTTNYTYDCTDWSITEGDFIKLDFNNIISSRPITGVNTEIDIQ